jgi:FtsH-binding integral membrane protein
MSSVRSSWLSSASRASLPGYPCAMSETSTGYYREGVAPRAISTAQLMGQVLFLVAVALGFCALGTLIGRDLSLGTARAFSFAGFGMLLVSSFAGERFRVGPFVRGWLFATALLIGLGIGPVIEYFATVEPDALTQAFAGTAATENDTIWLATGIFVSIVNIFLSLLNIFSSR